MPFDSCKNEGWRGGQNNELERPTNGNMYAICSGDFYTLNLNFLPSLMFLVIKLEKDEIRNYNAHIHILIYSFLFLPKWITYRELAALKKHELIVFYFLWGREIVYQQHLLFVDFRRHCFSSKPFDIDAVMPTNKKCLIEHYRSYE